MFARSPQLVKHSMHPGTRRIDIDLLRAVAVLAVILFHFDVPGFTGGFLGVDMFFVISGYLITRHIRQQLVTSTFSYMSFYVRRIRRLFPVFAVVLVLTSIASLLLLPLSLLQEFSYSSISSATYVANIFFWYHTDYFDTARIYKPLLHIWSLSVEEQFYIFWPVFIVFFFKRQLMVAIVLAGCVSLASAVCFNLPSATTFYFFPFRIFEFAIGAAISRASFSSLSRPLANGLAVAALFGIGMAIICTGEHAPTPGWGTLTIITGTAVVIALCHPQLNKDRACFSPLLRVGLISYSAYLVHWPLVVFYKYIFPGLLSPAATVFLLLATFLLADVLYRYIELPSYRIDLDKRKFQLLAFVPILLLFSVGFNKYYPFLYTLQVAENREVRNMLDRIPAGEDVEGLVELAIQKKRFGIPNPNRKTILILGDSHAADLMFTIRLALGGDNVKVIVVHSTCDPLTMESITVGLDELYENYIREETRKEEKCSTFHKGLLGRIEDASPDIIIFSEAWRHITLSFLPETIRAIQRRVSAPILVLGRVPQFLAPPQVLYKNEKRVEDINWVAWSRRNDAFDSFDEELQGIADKTGASFLSKRRIVCPNYTCTIQIGADIAYSDSQHWTPAGMQYYGNLLVNHELFQRLLYR